MSKKEKNEPIPSRRSTQHLVITGLYGGFFVFLGLIALIDIFKEDVPDLLMIPPFALIILFGLLFWYFVFRGLKINSMLKNGDYQDNTVIKEGRKMKKYYYEGDDPYDV